MLCRAKTSNDQSALIIFSILVLGWGLVPAAAPAAITVVGDVIPAYGSSDPWNIAGDLHVGQSASASMDISAGGQVTDSRAYIGVMAGSTGVVTVTGPGSLWHSTQLLHIGESGEGTLTVSDGGVVKVERVSIPRPPGWIIIEPWMESIMAVEPGSVAHAVVTGTGSLWHNECGLMIAQHGTADVLVADGGRLTSGSLRMGYFSEGVGSLVVSGPNSVCEIDGWTRLGYGGTGTLTISEGALVSSTGSAALGGMESARGDVTVTDVNSIWRVGGTLYVGGQGHAELLVAAGGRVESEYAYLNDVATVTGPGSVWQTANQLYIGGDENGPQRTAFLGIYNEGLVDGNSVTIWSTGTVAGDGTLRADHVVNHGTIRPGSSIGTLSIDGDLNAIHDTSVIEIEIDNEGNSDKLLVSGHVGFKRQAIVPVPLETIIGTHQYTVVEANSVEEKIPWIGWPSHFGIPEPGLLRSLVTVDSGAEPNSILLSVTALAFDDPSIVRTGNQDSVGAALGRIAADGGNDLTTALQQLGTADEVRQAYNQLSGQTMPSLAPVTVGGATRYLGTVSNRLRQSAGVSSNDVGFPTPGLTGPDGMHVADTLQVDAGGYLFAVGSGSPYLGDQPWGIWGKGYGLFGDRETESGVPGSQHTIYGTSFGLDYRFTEQLLLGLTGSYAEGDIDYAGSRDSADVESTHVGLYGSYDTAKWYLDSILAYGDLDYETVRYVDLLGERLKGDPSGRLVTAYVEMGFDWYRSAAWLLQPLASFQFSYLDLEGYTESGGTSALTYEDRDFESYKGSLGLRVRRRLFDGADAVRAVAELRGRWLHEFGDRQPSIDAHFAANPSAVFTISDSEISRDSAVLGTGVDVRLSKSTRLYFDYDAVLNPDKTDHVVSAAFEYRW